MKISMENQKSILFVLLFTIGLLLVPLIAMQFTEEIQWTLFDFLIAGLLLSGTGLAYLFIKKVSHSIKYRVALAITLLTSLVMIWANLAVGLIGSENEAINQLYFVLIATVFLAGYIVKFQPKGMFKVMMLIATLQISIVFIALFLGYQHVYGSSVAEILAVNGFFILLWASSGLLFKSLSHQNNVEEAGV
jgi:uncharacterized protein YqgC (DUF456 family)